MHESSNDISYELQQLSGWLYDGRGGYSLGLLLRKLPPLVRIRKNDMAANRPTSIKEFRAEYREGRFNDPVCYADTPEDAACKLLIELIKSKVITP